MPQDATDSARGRRSTCRSFYDTVQTLDQVVDVDYYVPGCPPAGRSRSRRCSTWSSPRSGQAAAAQGRRARRGRHDLLRRVPARHARRRRSSGFVRPHEIIAGSREVPAGAGHPLLGPATRAGCGALCPAVDMPCSGCYGPPHGVVDQGAKMAQRLGLGHRRHDPEEIDRDPRRHPRPGRARSTGSACPRLAAQEECAKVMKTRITHRPHHPARGPRQDRDLPRRRRATSPNAYFQIPELRGFEAFCVGRPVEEMPRITHAHLRRLPRGPPHGRRQGRRRRLPRRAAARRPRSCASCSTTPSTSPTTPPTSTPSAAPTSSSGPTRRRPSATSSASSTRSAWRPAARSSSARTRPQRARSR